MRRGADGPVFKIVMAQDCSRMRDDFGDSRHSRIAVGVNEVDLFVHDDLIVIPESRDHDQGEAEEKKKPAFH